MSAPRPIHTERAPTAIGPYSQAIVTGDLLFVSGQIGLDPSTGQFRNENLHSEICRAMDNLSAVLEAGDSELSLVSLATLYLTDMNDFAEVNEIYGNYFGDHRPARATVEVSGLPKGARFEISAIAQTRSGN
ncbi:MAG: RidA family protein [Planctomycetota bacterium]|nr:RidA family protein [Planctomycetota bacterium]